MLSDYCEVPRRIRDRIEKMRDRADKRYYVGYDVRCDPALYLEHYSHLSHRQERRATWRARLRQICGMWQIP